MQPSRYARFKREHEALSSKMAAGQTELRPGPLMLDGRSCRARRGTLLRSDARDVEYLVTLVTSDHEILVSIPGVVSLDGIRASIELLQLPIFLFSL